MNRSVVSRGSGREGVCDPEKIQQGSIWDDEVFSVLIVVGATQIYMCLKVREACTEQKSIVPYVT